MNTSKNTPAGGNQPAEPSVRRLILLGLLTRTLTDSGVQAFFPFLGIIAAGLGVSEALLGRLVALRASTGLLAPLFGVLADRHGYRRVMSLALGAAGLGYLIVAAGQSWPITAAGMVLAGLGTFAFVPNLSAYLSARLPFHRRSRGLGIVEYAWALAGILGLSLIGLLIEWTSWRLPFSLLGLAFLLAALFYRRLPSTGIERREEKKEEAGRRLVRFFDLGRNRRSTWAVLAGSFFVAIGGFTLILTFGIWLQREYQLGAGELGTVALIMGICDLTGSGLVSLIGDRLGKRRSVLLGTGLAVAGLLLLPQLNVSLPAAVAGLFLARGAFEFTIVSNQILLSEQVPSQRGKVLTLGAAATMLGSTLVGFTAVPTFDRFGIAGISLSGAAAIAVAFALFFFLARESGLEEPSI